MKPKEVQLTRRCSWVGALAGLLIVIGTFFCTQNVSANRWGDCTTPSGGDAYGYPVACGEVYISGCDNGSSGWTCHAGVKPMNDGRVYAYEPVVNTGWRLYAKVANSESGVEGSQWWYLGTHYSSSSYLYDTDWHSNVASQFISYGDGIVKSDTESETVYEYQGNVCFYLRDFWGPYADIYSYSDYHEACAKPYMKRTVEKWWKMTAKPVDTNGKAISGMSDKSSGNVRGGSTAVIEATNAPAGYTFVGWKSNADASEYLTHDKKYSKKLTSNVTVYMVYEKNEFSARATSINTRIDGKETTTGFVKKDATTDTLYVDCESNSCSVRFQFDIKRVAGSGDTVYTIINNNGNEVGEYNNRSTSGGVLDDLHFDVGLDVGQRVCYSMKVRGREADNYYFTVTACAAAPYNFTTSTEPNVKDDEIIYSGEEKNIDYTVTVSEKDNDAVGKKYCTLVPNASHGIQVQYNNGAWEDARLVPEERLGCGDTPQSKTIIIKDVVAGTPICIRTFITPANSGNDTNLSVAGFKGVAYSPDKAKCFLVAKRPNMQILGGSYYSGKRTVTSTAFKHIGDSVRVFGSWGEQSVIGVGTISGFASGSANSSTLGSNTGFCQYRTLLTFNNIPCSGDATQNGIGVATANDNRDALVDYWVADSVKQESVLTINIGDDTGTYTSVTTIAGKPVNYTNTTAKLTINGGTIVTGLSRIIKTSNDVSINGNISYADGEYSSVSQIPKLIILANNIEISCGVSRVDAILIARNSVNTCRDYKSEGIANEDDRVTQLTVRGMVIANKLIPSRTYGAGTAAESGVPAEIINYDSSTMLWAQYMAGSDDSGALTVTYQRELAPRY